jgi:hypothetical protein
MVVGILLAAVATSAEAKTKHRHVAHYSTHHHYARVAHHGHSYVREARHVRRARKMGYGTQVASIGGGFGGFNLGSFAGASGAGLIATAKAYSGRNPTRRSSQWCGEFMGLVVRQNGGRVPEGYAKASNWAKLPRTTEHPGAVAVMPHHVGIVTGQCENGGVQIVSGNYGRAKVGEGCVSRRQIIAFVQP